MRAAGLALALALALPLALALRALPAAANPGCAPPGAGTFHMPPAPCFRMWAGFVAPTGRYAHGVLGDSLEWGALEAELEGRIARLVLPGTRVFEDIVPRLADLDSDDRPEILVVESDAAQGARLAVYRASFPVRIGQPRLRLVAATPFIGQRFRWLAPVGAADLDGDGRVEIAWVETPHLGRILRVGRLSGHRVTEIAALAGLTNHRIGDTGISGGLRDCGAGPEMVLADPGWTRLRAVRFDGRTLQARDIGPLQGPAGFDAALACR